MSSKPTIRITFEGGNNNSPESQLSYFQVSQVVHDSAVSLRRAFAAKGLDVKMFVDPNVIEVEGAAIEVVKDVLGDKKIPYAQIKAIPAPGA